MKAISPTSVDEMHPHTITLPPPCLTVGRKFLLFNSTFVLRHTVTLDYYQNQKTVTFVSSEKKLIPPIVIFVNILFCELKYLPFIHFGFAYMAFTCSSAIVPFFSINISHCCWIHFLADRLPYLRS